MIASIAGMSSKPPDLRDIASYNRDDEGEDDHEEDGNDDAFKVLVWDKKTQLSVYVHMTLCFGDIILKWLCELVIAHVEFMGQQSKLVKCPVHLSIDGVNPVTLLMRLFDNESESNVLRAFISILTGAKWNVDAYRDFQLDKGNKECWPKLIIVLKTVEILNDLGVDIINGDRSFTTLSITECKGLVSALNADRPKHKLIADKAKVWVILKALTEMIGKSGVTITTIGPGDYLLKLPPMLTAFVNIDSGKDSWCAAPAEYKRFWIDVYKKKREAPADVNGNKRKRIAFAQCTSNVINKLTEGNSVLGFECEEWLKFKSSVIDLESKDIDDLVREVPDFNVYSLEREQSHSRCLELFHEVADYCEKTYIV